MLQAEDNVKPMYGQPCHPLERSKYLAAILWFYRRNVESVRSTTDLRAGTGAGGGGALAPTRSFTLCKTKNHRRDSQH